MTRSTRRLDATPSLVEPSDEAPEVRESRARLVAESYAERRRIERDLHDGVQQNLVAVAVNLQHARQLFETDTSAVAAVLEEIARDVREALEGVRDLAHEIYPPLLLDRGLSEAIAAAASTATVPTRVEPMALARYPEDVEATVYFCCVDALRDAADQSIGAAIVRIWQDDATLNFEVAFADGPDAPWFPSPVRLRSIQDRLGAVGGRLTVDSSPPGATSVTGTIPLGS